MSKELINYLVTKLVNKPEVVQIHEEIEEYNGRSSKVFYIEVDPEDIKIIIGKKGRTIQSIRNIVKTKAIKDREFVDVKIKEVF